MPIKNEAGLLCESAPLALDFAAGNCTPLPGGSATCAWYHGVWQYFRILGVVASPRLQEAFFLEKLRFLVASGQYRRILISGASDYGMLAVVLDALNLLKDTPQVTVVDRCETPLFLNRWYADRRLVTIDTKASDLLDYAPEEPFDLICTHSFFGNFPHDARAALVAKWWQLLRPGGKLVTVNRIRPGLDTCQTFSPKETDRFVEKVLHEGHRLAAACGVPVATLETWARIYAANYRSYPVATLGDFLGLFTSQGFALTKVEVEGHLTNPGTSAPSTPGEAMRVSLVATRG